MQKENTWVKHVKDYAQRKGITYTGALSDAKCRESYWRKKMQTGGDTVIQHAEERKIIGEMCNVQENHYNYWCKMCNDGVATNWGDMAEKHPFLKQIKNRNCM